MVAFTSAAWLLSQVDVGPPTMLWGPCYLAFGTTWSAMTNGRLARLACVASQTLGVSQSIEVVGLGTLVPGGAA